MKIILIGSSTGGPNQLKFLLKDLIIENSCVVIAQHMSHSFIPSFVRQFNQEAKSEVLLASDKEKLETNEKINKEINKIMALVEKYPELKANTNFLNLSQNLSDVEDELAKSRRYYNAIVRMYNNKVEMIPSNLVAKIFGYKIKDMFSVEDEERENVEVKL